MAGSRWLLVSKTVLGVQLASGMLQHKKFIYLHVFFKRDLARGEVLTVSYLWTSINRIFALKVP